MYWATVCGGSQKHNFSSIVESQYLTLILGKSSLVILLYIILPVAEALCLSWLV